MTALAILLLMGGALGAGATTLRGLGVDRTLALPEHFVWSFVLGFGALGWVLFFPAVGKAVSPAVLALVCAAGLPGMAFLIRRERRDWRQLSLTSVTLLSGIGLALLFDLLEGLSPPADADSLAYHFAIPKLYLEAKGLFFIPRANDGAVPMLQQMTYMAALGMGGEQAMTMWCTLTSWGTAAAVYVTARQHVGTEWALATALAFLTIPAVIYGGGSGQVEARNAAFVLLSASAAVRARTNSDARYAALAGISAGFYAASKYPGLLFVAVAALPLLLHRRWPALGAAYGLAALAAGSQWYVWNAWNTGDPVFPMLYGWLQYSDGISWNAEHHRLYLETFRAAEKSLDATFPLLLLYPFYATFSVLPAVEARLIGFGPLPLLLLPAALVGIWARRSSVWHSPLIWIAAICFLAYALWFFLGPSLRLRFHLPLYPLFLICVVVATQRAVSFLTALHAPVVAGFVVSLAFHAAIHGVFTLNYAKYIFTGESRDAFLRRNISLYDGVTWLNGHLGSKNRVAVFYRETNYLLDIPYFYVNSLVDNRIDTRLGRDRTALIWEQLRTQGLTHVMIEQKGIHPPDGANFGSALAVLLRDGCLIVAAEIPSQVIASRTLSGGKGSPAVATVLELTPRTCPLGTPASPAPG